MLQELNLNYPRPTGARKGTELEVFKFIDFYAHRRVRLAGIRGTLFTCSRADENIMGMFSNVTILRGSSQYAPELRRTFVFVADRKLS